MDSKGGEADQRSSQDVPEETKTAKQVKIKDIELGLRKKKTMRKWIDEDIAELEKKLAQATAEDGTDLQVRESEDGDKDNHSATPNAQSSVPAETKDCPPPSKLSDSQLQKDLEEIFSGNMSPSQSSYYSNPSLLLSTAPTNAPITTPMSPEIETKLKEGYESLFEKAHQLFFGSSAAAVTIKAHLTTKVANLQHRLNIQEKEIANFHEMSENMEKEMIEMKNEKEAYLEENTILNEALEKKIEVNRHLTQQSANLTEKYKAEYASFQKTNETKNNKIRSLERTINDQAARIKELQQMDHCSHEKMKRQEKEHEKKMYKKESELRNSHLREKQSEEEIQNLTKQVNEALGRVMSSNAKRLEAEQKYEDVLEESEASSEKNLELSKECKHYKEFNTLLKEKLAEERKQNLEKQKNGE